jgi:hypothetical protein
MGAADLGATVALNFTGSSFEVRGMLVQAFPSPVAAYSLDSGPWVPVQMPPNGSDYTNAQSNFEFVGQTFDAVENHSLVITPLIPGAFFLDYITVQAPLAAFPPKANVVAAPNLTSSIGTAQSASQNRGLHAGVVAGICITIAVCLGVAALAVFLLRRRRQRRRQLSTAEFSASIGTMAMTDRLDMSGRNVTPVAVTRDDELSGSTRSAQQPIGSTNLERADKSGLRTEPAPPVPLVRVQRVVVDPPMYTE